MVQQHVRHACVQQEHTLWGSGVLYNSNLPVKTVFNVGNLCFNSLWLRYYVMVLEIVIMLIICGVSG